MSILHQGVLCALRGSSLRSLRLKALCLFLATLTTVTFCPAVAQQKPILLKGGKLLTITHGVIENGSILIDNDKITAIGPASSTKPPKTPASSTSPA